MSGIDWGAIGTWGLSGLAFGAMFSLTIYIALRSLAFEFLGSPVMQAIAQGIRKFSGEGKGDWKSMLISKGLDMLTGPKK